MEILTEDDIKNMVMHWLNSPTNSYFGVEGGNNLDELLQQPFIAGKPEEVIAKLKKDEPILQALPPNAINIYKVDRQPDQSLIYIEVSGQLFPVG